MDNLEIIDLTYPLEEGMPTFSAGWHPKVSITQLGRLGLEGRVTREISFGTHTGTHMDAPLHFIEGGRTIDQIPLNKTIGNVTIVDLSFLKEGEHVTIEILSRFKISKRMIFKFGWGQYWGKNKYFRNYPYFTEETANYLIAKGVELIGLDTPSPDDSNVAFGSEKDSSIHKIFLRAEIILVEYLANLDIVTEYVGWNIVATPLKIKDSDGSPARVYIFKEGDLK